MSEPVLAEAGNPALVGKTRHRTALDGKAKGFQGFAASRDMQKYSIIYIMRMRDVCGPKP